MNMLDNIKSQYLAALEMLREAIVSCPDSEWENPDYKNQFWQIAFHVIFYTHFYLHRASDEFVPWEKHRDEYVSLGESAKNPKKGAAYHKEEILTYHALCLEQVEEKVDALDLEAESGFHWLPFNKFELQFYNIRHLQQHTGELCERLGARGAIEVGWVGMGPAER